MKEKYISNKIEQEVQNYVTQGYCNKIRILGDSIVDNSIDVIMACAVMIQKENHHQELIEKLDTIQHNIINQMK